MKKTKFSILAIITLALIACSSEPKERKLTSPGFGVTATSIRVADEGIDIPVLLISDEVIKGMQFTLSWNPNVGQVIKPALTESNQGFTISSSEGERGEMKVLIFSMTGDVLNTAEPVVMNIPIRIIDPEAEAFELFFYDAIFAGPKAVSYEIPVTHAKLKITR